MNRSKWNTYTSKEIRNIKVKEPNLYEEIAQFIGVGIAILVVFMACVKVFG